MKTEDVTKMKEAELRKSIKEKLLYTGRKNDTTIKQTTDTRPGVFLYCSF